jgi:hypothetical protein
MSRSIAKLEIFRTKARVRFAMTPLPRSTIPSRIARISRRSSPRTRQLSFFARL